MSRSLAQIANDVGCEKLKHCGYHKVYPKYLERLRPFDFVMWEIGVDQGASLRMWSEYLRCVDLYGFDIDPACLHLEVGKSKAMISIEDATKDGFADDLPDPLVVIDDGSHKPADQMKTFLTVWPRVLPGGLYFIEDLHIWNEGSFVYHLAGLGIEVLQTNRRKVKAERSILHYPALSVAAVHMHPGLCVLEKA